MDDTEMFPELHHHQHDHHNEPLWEKLRLTLILAQRLDQEWVNYDQEVIFGLFNFLIPPAEFEEIK